MPETWGEVSDFKSALRTIKKAKKEIWRRRKPEQAAKVEYFSVFAGNHFTRKRRYRIHWIYSSEKRQRDRKSREASLAKAEQDLLDMNTRLNTRHLKTTEEIEAATLAIVEKHGITDLLTLRIGASQEQDRVQIGKGRPGKNTRYKTRTRKIHNLTWTRNLNALKIEARLDGLFPLLCTDTKLTAKDVLQAYKYQPRLEKRFNQFKSFHNVAPFLFKKVSRVEANLFVFFIALIIQALLEREVRSKMAEDGQNSLLLYPEEREAERPTTNKIIDVFDGVSTYSIIQDDSVVEEFKDELNATQMTILSYLNISEVEYWRAA